MVQGLNQTIYSCDGSVRFKSKAIRHFNAIWIQKDYHTH